MYKLYLHVFLRRRMNLNRKNDYVSSTTENALLPVQEQRWNWLKPTTTIEASSYTNKEREKKGERESIMAHHRGRVDEKGGEKKGGKKGKKKINFQDRGNSVAFIAILPSHDLENREFLKSGGFAFKKQTVFTPLRPSLAFNPLLLLGFFFNPESLLLRHFSSLFPFFFFSLPFFEFNRRLTPWNFRRNPSEYAGYASSASPPLISSLRCEMISRNQEKIYLPLPPSLSLSVSCGLKTESFKGERRISPRTNVFSHSFYAFLRGAKGELSITALRGSFGRFRAKHWKIPRSNERSHGSRGGDSTSRGFVSKIINHDKKRKKERKEDVAGKIDSIWRGIFAVVIEAWF